MCNVKFFISASLPIGRVILSSLCVILNPLRIGIFKFSESSLKYSDLPHDAEDWESYSVRDEKVDLDNDGEDELILDGPYGGMYLDERDGKVYVLAEGEGTAGYLSYADYEGKTYIIHSDTSHAGRQIFIFDRYEDGKSVENFTLSAEYWENTFDAYDQDSDFIFKDQKISMEEYEALTKELFGFKTKLELMEDWAQNEIENLDNTQGKIVNDDSDRFYEELAKYQGEYSYVEDGKGLTGKLSIIQKDAHDYEIDDTNSTGYRFLSLGSDVQYIQGNRIFLKYPETVYADGDAVFKYYVILCYENFVYLYETDENFENYNYLYTGWVKY